MKGSNNGDLKVFMVRHYSCCKYVNNQSKFVETRLNLQTNWFVIFDRNGSNYGEKLCFNRKYNYTLVDIRL